AETFLNKQVAWSGAPDTETGRMLRIERLAGLIDDAKLRDERATFLAGWMRQSSRTRFVRGVAWIVGFAAPVETKDDADEAIREMPSFGEIPVGLRSALNDEALGRTMLLAGRADDAVAPLLRASRMCTSLDAPFRHA